MQTSVRAALTALTAALLLATAISTASARNLEVSNQALRVTWTNLEFTNTIGLEAIRCKVTLEGSFHSRTIAKVARLLIGAITRANFGNCTNGNFTTQLLPWHLTYESFNGTLPSIPSMIVLLSRFRVLQEAAGGLCNASYGNETDNISFTATREGGGGITTLQPVIGRNEWSRVTTLSGFCPTRGGFVGSGNVTVLNGTARVTVRLI